MACLICAQAADGKMCSKCNKLYLYDYKHNLIRRKKHFFTPSSTRNKDYMGELLVYSNVCKIYDKKKVFRNVHPLWAKTKKNVLLEYDVAIPSEKLLIEYDGKQHFIYPNFFHKTKKEFLAQKKRDKLKENLAKKNGWKLVRFSYKDRIDNINIERKLKIC